jgi:hypothetical protein
VAKSALPNETKAQLGFAEFFKNFVVRKEESPGYVSTPPPFVGSTGNIPRASSGSVVPD